MQNWQNTKTLFKCKRFKFPVSWNNSSQRKVVGFWAVSSHNEKVCTIIVNMENGRSHEHLTTPQCMLGGLSSYGISVVALHLDIHVKSLVFFVVSSTDAHTDQSSQVLESKLFGRPGPCAIDKVLWRERTLHGICFIGNSPFFMLLIAWNACLKVYQIKTTIQVMPY